MTLGTSPEVAAGRGVAGVPVFVTGASRGIGSAIARRLGVLGARVAVGYRERASEAAAVAEAIGSAGGTAICVRADVAREDEVERAFSQIEDELGPVAALVNNAGSHVGSRIGGLSMSSWLTCLDSNLTSAFLCSRRAVPAMRRQGWGRIVNVTSVVGLNGFPGDVAYASAKAGMIGLTRSLALELASEGIAVNAIAPGFVTTEMTQALAPTVLERLERSIPLRRQAMPEEIAETVTFLLDSPGYMTGSVMVADGGWTIG